MPFRSKAQMRKFGAMVARGEMADETFRRWLAETPRKKALPERVQEKNTRLWKRVKRRRRKR